MKLKTITVEAFVPGEPLPGSLHAYGKYMAAGVAHSIPTPHPDYMQLTTEHGQIEIRRDARGDHRAVYRARLAR